MNRYDKFIVFLDKFTVFNLKRYYRRSLVTEWQSHRHPRVLSIWLGEIFLGLISINSPTRFTRRGINILLFYKSIIYLSRARSGLSLYCKGQALVICTLQNLVNWRFIFLHIVKPMHKLKLRLYFQAELRLVPFLHNQTTKNQLMIL